MIALLLMVQDLPVAPDGWRVELLAAAPAVRNPTAVAVAPSGRVYVGEDPMDMEGPVDARLGRVLCIHPDGKISVFADKLGPVFGLAWHDDRLYIHDCYRVAAWKDVDGVGRDAREILPATHPNPSGANRYNTHIPAGIRISPDAWFYMAVGDKGIPGMPRPDGSVFRFRGGGVVRFRPDGSAIESFATGTRNITDVAVTAAGDLFAFDNDDNALWGARVLHVRKDADFGYPWNRGKPWVTPALHEARGIPAGCAAFGDDVLLCDWGRSKVTRYRFERRGDTFGVIGRESLFSAGASEFRPVCIATAGDVVVVTDWNTAARRVKQEVGRVIRFTRTRPLPPPAPFSGTPPPPRTSSAVDEIEILARGLFVEPPWDGSWWGTRAALNPRPLPGVEHAETPRLRALLQKALSHADPVARAAAAEGLAADPESVGLLRGRLAVETGPLPRRALFAALVRRSAAEPGPFVEAFDPVLFEDACRVLRDPGAAVRALEKAEPSRVPALLAVVARIGPAEAARVRLRHPDPRIRAAAVEAVAALLDRESIPDLLMLGSEALPALVRMPDARAKELYAAALGGRRAELRLGAARALAQLGMDPGASKPPPPADVQGGEPAKGRVLFHDPGGLGCARCHMVGADGGDIGPELTMVGAVYGRRDLAEHILNPERIIHGAYRQHVLRLRSGDVVSGVLRREDAEEVVLGDADGATRAWRKKDIESRRIAESSIMPAGLADGLLPAEFADLLAYLESLKGDE